MSFNKSTHSQSEEDRINGCCNLSNLPTLDKLNESDTALKIIKDKSETGNIFPLNKKKKEEWTFMLCLCGLATNLGACIPVGFSIGVLNTPQAIIRDFCNSTIEYRYGIHLGISEMNILWSVIVSIPLVSGMAGSLCCGCFADRYGRKWTLFYTVVVATVAAVFLTCSRWALSVEMLLIGRLLLGFAAGLVTGISPLYLTEVAPLGLRGMMGVLTPMGLSSGVFIAQVLGFSFILGHESTWHYLIGLYATLTIPSMALILYLPESPKYLYVVKGLKDEGIRELIRLRNVSQSELKEDLDELCMERMQQDKNDCDKFGMMQLLQARHLRLPLLLVLSMHFGQQLSGINAVFYYSMTIFEQAGLGESGSQIASVCAGGVNLTMAVISLSLVGHFTRRRLILTSCLSAATCLVMLILVIIFIDYSWWMPYISIFAVLAFVFCFGLGLAPIPFFIGSELFEVGPRPTVMALGSMMNWGGNFTVGMTFPILQQLVGPWAFAPFAISLYALAVFLNANLPETKGLDPVKVSHLFSQPRCTRCKQPLLPHRLTESDREAILPTRMTISTVYEDQTAIKS